MQSAPPWRRYTGRRSDCARAPSSAVAAGEIDQLLLQIVDRPLEHVPVCGARGAAQLFSDPAKRQLDGGATPVGGILPPRRCLQTLGFVLLELDVLALEASSHTVFYRHARHRDH